MRATGLAEGAETQSVAGAADGTVFLMVAVRDGAWLLGVPDGGGAGPLLAQLEDRIYAYALVVEPAQVWAVLPAATGTLALDLTTGELRGPLAVDCTPKLDVRALYPASTGRADDRRVRHPARGHPDAVVPRPGGLTPAWPRDSGAGLRFTSGRCTSVQPLYRRETPCVSRCSA